MTNPDDHAARILKTLADIEDPTLRAKATSAMLDAVPALQKALREIRQQAVGELRSQGLSHAEVAVALGVSRARAQQIAEGRTSGKRREPEPVE